MSAAKTILCRLLIALMAWTPFQLAQAGMIGAGQTAAAPQAQRDAVSAFLARADVARELQALGLDPAAAQARVAALSDEEIRAIAGDMRGLPAGGTIEGWILAAIVVAVVWYIFWGQYKQKR
ncbi:MAG TPA: PA2779 family protein [Burkholderiales bacterium]